MVGTLMIGIVGDSTHTLTDSLFFGGSLGLLGTQAIAAFAVFAYSFTVTFVIALGLKAVMGIRVSEEEEITGIDQLTHAETAYEIAGGITGGGSSTPALTRPTSVEVSS